MLALFDELTEFLEKLFSDVDRERAVPRKQGPPAVGREAHPFEFRPFLLLLGKNLQRLRRNLAAGETVLAMQHNPAAVGGKRDALDLGSFTGRLDQRRERLRRDIPSR